MTAETARADSGADLASFRRRLASIVDRPWKMLIAGELRAAKSAATMSAVHPGDASVIAQIPSGEAADVDAAVSAAVAASENWSRTPIGERAAALSALAGQVEAAGEELAWIDTSTTAARSR